MRAEHPSVDLAPSLWQDRRANLPDPDAASFQKEGPMKRALSWARIEISR